MSEFKVGDQVTFIRPFKVSNGGTYDGVWTVKRHLSFGVEYLVDLQQEGRCDYRAYVKDLRLVAPEQSRMIFPFEEFPEPELGEYTYREQSADPPDYMAMLDNVVSNSVPSWTSPPTYTQLLNGQRVWNQRFLLGVQPVPAKRVVHRASRGLRQPVVGCLFDPGFPYISPELAETVVWSMRKLGMP